MRALTHALQDAATRRLLITWAVLMGLTLLAMLSAQLGGDARQAALPLWSAGLLLAATLFKAHRVLMVYLGLSEASSAWRGAFVGLILTTLLLVASGYLVARLS